MDSLLLFLLKSSLCISIFLGIYWLFLKKETFYKFNRSYLLFGLLASLIIPFIQLSYQVVLPFSSQTKLEQNLVIDDSMPIVLNYLIPGLYFLGLILVFIYQILGLFKIRRLLKASQFKSLEGCKVLQTNIYKTSFSVFSYIFLDISENSSKKEQQLILQHEMAHVKQHHWADLVFAHIFCAMQWFNPLSWIYLHCIKQNHEFLADEQVLIKGYSGAE